MKPVKIACFAAAVADCYPAYGVRRPGGNALNQALRLRRLGRDTAFLGAVGTDSAGVYIAQLLQAAGVDVMRLRRVEGETASNALVVDEAGERSGVEGAWIPGVYEGFRLSEDDWAFLQGCGVWVTHADCADFAAACERKSGRFLAVDFLHLSHVSLLESSLAAVDLACVGGEPDMEDILAELAARSEAVVVLTLGAGGSVAFRGGERWRQPALPLSRVVDTTGCGDAFQAAFLSCWLDSQDPRASLLAGAQAGRDCAAHLGALDANLPSASLASSRLL